MNDNSTCEECGALVGAEVIDRERHSSWHTNIGLDFRHLYQLSRRPEPEPDGSK